MQEQIQETYISSTNAAYRGDDNIPGIEGAINKRVYQESTGNRKYTKEITEYTLPGKDPVYTQGGYEKHNYKYLETKDLKGKKGKTLRSEKLIENPDPEPEIQQEVVEEVPVVQQEEITQGFVEKPVVVEEVVEVPTVRYEERVKMVPQTRYQEVIKKVPVTEMVEVKTKVPVRENKQVISRYPVSVVCPHHHYCPRHGAYIWDYGYPCGFDYPYDFDYEYYY